MKESKTWEECAQFHGHECGGLALGYQLSRYAIELLNIMFDEDEKVVCIAEAQGCPLDGIHVMLRCGEGRNELQTRKAEIHAFSFFNLKTGESVRLTQREYPKMERHEMKDYILSQEYHQLFDRGEVLFALEA